MLDDALLEMIEEDLPRIVLDYIRFDTPDRFHAHAFSDCLYALEQQLLYHVACGSGDELEAIKKAYVERVFKELTPVVKKMVIAKYERQRRDARGCYGVFSEEI
jgi:hypothetical protein